MGTGLDGKSCIIGKTGGHLGSLVKDAIQLRHLDLHQLVDLRDLARGHGVFLKKRIHIQPIALLAGHAPGRGVRLLQKSHAFQLGHFIADGGGGAGQQLAFGDIFGANRLAALNMRLDNGLQDLLFPFA